MARGHSRRWQNVLSGQLDTPPGPRGLGRAGPGDTFLLLCVPESGTFLNPGVKEPSHPFMEPVGVSPSAPSWSLGVLMHEINSVTPAWPVPTASHGSQQRAFVNWSVAYQGGFLLFILKHFLCHSAARRSSPSCLQAAGCSEPRISFVIIIVATSSDIFTASFPPGSSTLCVPNSAPFAVFLLSHCA